MNLSYVLPLLCFIFCFVFSILTIQYCIKAQKTCSPEIIITASTFLFTLIYALPLSDTQDFISDLNIRQYLIPFMSACILALLYRKPINRLLKYISFIILISSIIFGFKLDIKIFPLLSPELNRIFGVLIWSFITLTFYITNRLTNQINSTLIMFGFSFFVLSLLGASPKIFGISALFMGGSALACFIKTDSFPKLRLSDTGADCLGFLLGYFIICSIPEYSFGSVMILMFFTIMEIVFALIQKITFLDQFKNIQLNTACGKALSAGLPEKTILSYCFRIGLLQTIFACFQLYGNSPYSLWFICAVIIAWQQYRLINWQQFTLSFKETNKQIADSVTANLSTLKKSFNKTDEKK